MYPSLFVPYASAEREEPPFADTEAGGLGTGLTFACSAAERHSVQAREMICGILTCERQGCSRSFHSGDPFLTEQRDRPIMEKRNSVSADKMKIPKKIARLIVILVFSAVISFCLRDVIHIFADAFLPDSTLTLRIVPSEDGAVRDITIIEEKYNNEIFPLFEKKFTGAGAVDAPDGWSFIEGEPFDPGKIRTWVPAAEDGKTPTVQISENTDSFFPVIEDPVETEKNRSRILAAEEGKTLTVSLPDNPDSYFAVIRDPSSGSFEMSVNGERPQTVDCSVEKDSVSGIVRIHPFEDPGDRTRTKGYRTVGFIVSMLVWCFVLNELTRNVHFDREEKEN